MVPAAITIESKMYQTLPVSLYAGVG